MNPEYLGTHWSQCVALPYVTYTDIDVRVATAFYELMTTTDPEPEPVPDRETLLARGRKFLADVASLG